MSSLSKPGVSLKPHCPEADSTLLCVRTSAQKWNAEKPVDGTEPCSSSSSRRALTTVPGLFSEGSCWKRGQKPLAGRGRMPGFGEKQPGSPLCCFCPPLPLPEASETCSPPSDFLALNTALTQEVAEILMCCQNKHSEAASDLVLV